MTAPPPPPWNELLTNFLSEKGIMRSTGPYFGICQTCRFEESHHRACIVPAVEAALAEIARLTAAVEEAREKYYDLLYQVATKHPNESRHETAKRYIRQIEERHGSESQAALAAGRATGEGTPAETPDERQQALER